MRMQTKSTTPTDYSTTTTSAALPPYHKALITNAEIAASIDIHPLPITRAVNSPNKGKSRTITIILRRIHRE